MRLRTCHKKKRRRLTPRAQRRRQMLLHYILHTRRPAVVDLFTWARWFERANRHIGQTEINGVFISTVFLGIDHGWFGPKPLLFETMVFGGSYDQRQERYATMKEAEQGHAKWVEAVRFSEDWPGIIDL